MKKLYFLPGTMCSKALWQHLELTLKKQFELVYLGVPNGMGLNELVTYYETIFDTEAVNLVGFSMGGYIAAYLQCALEHKVKRSLIISNTPSLLPDYEVKQRLDSLKLIAEHGYNGLSTARASALLGPSNCSWQMIKLLKKMDASLGKDTLFSQYTHFSQRQDLYGPLCISSIPTLFYCACGDLLIDKAWLTDLCTANEFMKVSWSTGSGHMLPLEVPSELTQILIDWFL